MGGRGALRVGIAHDASGQALRMAQILRASRAEQPSAGLAAYR
jgi:hypothetical protein